MTREELEKIFDEEIKSITMDYDDNWNPLLYNPNNTLKQFIFETIIPEVLKSLLINSNWIDWTMWVMIKWFNHQIKWQAKELYWIDL